MPKSKGFGMVCRCGKEAEWLYRGKPYCSQEHLTQAVVDYLKRHLVGLDGEMRRITRIGRTLVERKENKGGNQ